MKRLVLTLSSLAILGVACGRVSRNVDDDPTGVSGSGSGGTNGNGKSGGDVIMAGGSKSTGGKPSGVGSGGKLTGTPGGTFSEPMVGGESTGGTTFIGGDSGVGGSIFGAGGAPPDAQEACAIYCSAYSEVCPQAGLGSPDECASDCLASLELDSASCNEGKRAAYECIGNALFQASNDCSTALVIAKKLCGSATPQVDACNDTCVAVSIYGDGGGCHASADCNGLEVDLHCQEVNTGQVPCTCSIGGKEVWDIATGFDYSKAGCIDDALFRLCAKELP